jgi:hypothetical protein
MGGCCSLTLPVPARYYESTEFQRAADLLYLNDAELRTLWTCFSRLLLNSKDKVIRVLDLLRRLDIPPTGMAQRAFEIADVRGLKQVSFRDFVICVWSFATMDRPSLIAFVWDVLLAENGGDDIELSGLRSLIEEVLGSTLSNKSRRYIDEAIARAPTSRLLGRQFYFLADKDNEMLQPAFWLQRNLQIKVGGRSFWRVASERRAMFSNMQSWKDIIKQLFPGMSAHPDSMPAVSQTLPGGGVAPETSRSGKKSGRKSMRKPIRGAVGMASIARRPEGRMGGAAMTGNMSNPREADGAPGGTGATGRRKSVSSAPMSARRSSRALSARSDRSEGEGESKGEGAPTASEARDLIRRAAASDYYTSGKKRETPEAAAAAAIVMPVPSAATPYIFPQIVRIVGAGGAGGAWPVNPNAALGMAMGLDPSFAVALTQADRVKGYYRRARKHNLPTYVLHTAPGSTAAQFSMPGVQDGVRGRWRYARRKATVEDKRAGFAIARGGGFFSGIGLNQNKVLDTVFDAEVIRIQPAAVQPDKEKSKGTVAQMAATAKSGDTSAAPPSARGVAGADQRLGQAPSYKLEGYTSVAAKQKDIERTMEQLEEEQRRRQEEAMARVQELEEVELAADAARAAAAAERLNAAKSRRALPTGAPSRRVVLDSTPVELARADSPTMDDEGFGGARVSPEKVPLLSG